MVQDAPSVRHHIVYRAMSLSISLSNLYVLHCQVLLQIRSPSSYASYFQFSPNIVFITVKKANTKHGPIRNYKVKHQTNPQPIYKEITLCKIY